MGNSNDETGTEGTVSSNSSGYEDTSLRQGEIKVPDERGRHGRGRGHKPSAVPPYPIKDHQKILFKRHAQAHNCWIVLGRDSYGPDGGKGDLGQTNCGAIDIVVGRGSFLKEKKATTVSHPMFAGGDAARIYISERADVDKYFKLREPEMSLGWPHNLMAAVGSAITGQRSVFSSRDQAVMNSMGIVRSENRSCVGISADAVRIIGQEGVKIVTKAGTQNNSRGQEILGIPGIHLIAGDAPDTLQPMVLGKNVTQMFLELIELQLHTIKALRSLSTVVRGTNASLLQHAHPTVGVGVGTALTPNTSASKQLDNILKAFQDCTLEANNVTTRLMNLPSIYLSLSGKKHIMSQYCKVN